MKSTIIAFFIILGFNSFAQQHKKNIEANVYNIIDNNANILIKNSSTNSVSIGIVKNGKVYTKHYGEIDKGKNNKANDNTLFEIASVTKIFTGTLMSKAVLEGKISLEDDIRKYIIGSYPNLEYNGKPIKIKDLVSFKSALNKELPDNSESRKIENDSTTFNLQKIDKNYSKQKFFEELKTVKLDTIPGYKFRYSNLSLELSAHILENVYQKSYETLLIENILNPLNMKSTKLKLSKNDILANGYNGNHVLTASLYSNLWGSSGLLKSTMNDLLKLLSFELDKKNKIVQETQRNIYKSDTTWNGYFWDGIEVVDNGKFCHKQGGAYGTQTMLAVYPEQNLGICIIVNISTENTYNALFNSVLRIADDLKVESNSKSKIYGYKLAKDKVVFTYLHPKNLDGNLINSVSVAGSFNNWNAENKKYKMTKIAKNKFEIRIPISEFEKGKLYSFKFVINKIGWTTSPKNAINIENGEDKNLTFKIE
jgi:CubicO group peptidase (beta-lactamase class C family)